MNAKEFFGSLRAGKLLPVYVFCGKEDYLRQEAVRRLKKQALAGAEEGLDSVTLTNPTVQQIVENAETYPFMSPRRFILVRDAALIQKEGRASGEGDAGAGGKDEEALLDYLLRIPETCCLVFDCGEALDKRRKLGRGLSQLEGFVSFDPMEEADTAAFLMRHAKRAGVEIRQDACEKLIFLCGNDLGTLTTELDKLITYAGENGSVTPEAIEALCVKSAEAKIFEMIDDIVEKRTAKAYQQMETLLASGESRMGIISLVARQMRQMLYVRDLMDEGRPQSEIAARLGMKPFVVRKTAARVRSIDRGRLEKQLKQCIQAEYDVKSGAQSEEAVFDMLLMRLQ